MIMLFYRQARNEVVAGLVAAVVNSLPRSREPEP